MNVAFLNLEPAFNGVEGWLTITELDMIDPTPKLGAELKFKTEKEAVMADGTIFVYATPTQQDQPKC